MLKKAIICVTALATTVMLASCSLSTDQQAAAAKAYDKICSAEPQLYASYVLVATAKGASEAKLAKAEGIHTTITAMCTDRPTDVISALVILSAAYANFIALNAQTRT